MKSKKTIIAVITVLLVVAGVMFYVFTRNNDSDSSTENNTSQQTAKVLGQQDVDQAVESVEKWSAAYFEGNSDVACKLVTEKYVEQIAGQEDSPDDCKGQVDGGSALAKAFSIESSEFTYTGRIDNGTILVTSKWSGSEGVDDYEMVKVDGVWKIDAEIDVLTEEEKNTEARNTVVDEWNSLSQAERDSWYNDDGSGGYDAYAESKGVITE